MKKPALALLSVVVCVFAAFALPILQPISYIGTAVSAYLDADEAPVPLEAEDGKVSAPEVTYFSQDFSSSSVVADYVSATPNSGQFNAIGSSGVDMTISINSGRLQFVRNGANAGSYSRTTDFSPAPSALKFSMDLNVPASSFAATNAAVFQIGSGFGTANSAESNANTFARFGINWTATSGQWSLREIGTGVNSANNTGSRTITWFVNNSGSAVSYVAPDGSTESLANDRADLWIGNTRAFNDYTVTTPTQTLTDLKFAFTGGTGTIQIDNIQVEEIPAPPPVPDYVNLQWPPTFSGTGGQQSPTIFGQIWEQGLTDSPGQGAAVIAEVGYGPLGSDPRNNPSWVFTAAVFGRDAGNNDEYDGTFTLPSPASQTQYAYTYRYSLDAGATWTYGDLDGNGESGGLSFNPALLGTATVDPAPSPGISVSGGPLNFGDQTVSTSSSSLSLMVTNTGAGNLVLGTPAFTVGTQFAFVTDPNGTVIAPTESAFISFTFTPTSIGAKNDTLTITSNAGGTAPTIALTGMGTSENNIVFVTSTTHTGSLGGISGADNICQLRATSAGLTGTYRAWLSTDTVNPAGRFPQSTSPYTLVNGTVIANNWTDLTDGTLLAAIDRTELGDAVASSSVWTGTQANGTAGAFGNCSNWTSTAGVQSSIGTSSATTSAWTNSGTSTCTAAARLYCFLQVPTANLAADPTSVNLGDVMIGAPAGSSSVVITNSGTPVEITALPITGTNAAEFGATAVGGLPVTLNNGESLTVNLMFTPSATGSRSASLGVTSTPGSTLTVPLSGTGIDPPDTTPPDTSITDGPSGTVASSDATFDFASSEGGSTYECSLDGSAFAACSPGVEYTGLANGNHYFQVRATDGAGNTDGSPASRTWTVRAGAGAVTFFVDRLDDSASADECIDAMPNDCSLRRAIGTSQNGDIITFDPAIYTQPGLAPEGTPLGIIELGGTEIPITTNITITGPGASLLTIDGNLTSRIFYVVQNVSVDMSGLTLTGGNGDVGGAIAVDSNSSLDLTGTTITGNQATVGGALWVLGTITVTNSVISNNSAVEGGAIFMAGSGTSTLTDTTVSGNTAGNGGGVHGSSDDGNPSLVVTRSTFSNNCAGTRPSSADPCTPTGAGGGIYFSFSSLPASISNSTFSANSAATGGSIWIFPGNGSSVTSSTFVGGAVHNESFGSLLPVVNSIFAASCTGTNFVNIGYNIDTGSGCGFVSANNSMSNTDPLLGPLQDNGGPTWTHGFNLALGLSPAVDAGFAFGLTTDQRGMPRTVDIPGVANAAGGDGTDIGAFEMMAPTAAPVSVSGTVRDRSGRAISGAVITAQGIDGVTKSAMTGTYGSYRIEGLTAGASYMVTVSSRRHTFADGTQLISLDDNITGMDFTASQ